MSEILLVEDDPEDAELTLRALKDAIGAQRFVVVQDGLQALDFLNGRGAFKGRGAAPMPALVLLDIKMPLMDGFEFLRRLSAAWGPGLRGLRLAVLSSSGEPRDRAIAQALGVAHYFRKPATASEFASFAAEISRILRLQP